MTDIEEITEFEYQVIKLMREMEPRNKLIVEKLSGDTAGAVEIRRKEYIQEEGEKYDISK